MVRRAKEEYSRRGGWIRIFPTPDSWELYGSYLQSSSTNNFVLYQQLFPERAKLLPNKPITAGYMSSGSRSKTVNLHKEAYPQLHIGSQVDEFMTSAIQRSLQYERKLSSLGERSRRARTRTAQRRRAQAESNGQTSEGNNKGTVVQGIVEDMTLAEPAKTRASSETRASRREDTPSDMSKSQTSTPTLEKKQPERPPSAAKPKPIPPHLHVPRYKVVELLEKGYTMTKVQARFAFATYLTRVQHRLMAETGGTETEDVDTANEQMDLVLRFLKRAACNLQQPFKVVVPSRKLALNDRRRILAKQLGDFVHVYNKDSKKIIEREEKKKAKDEKETDEDIYEETDQLRQRSALEKRLRRPPHFSKNDCLDEVKFNQFVNMSTESELEEVLTTYTKLNKSASIFLGSNSKSTYDPRSTSSLTQAPSQSETSLIRRKELEQAQGRAEGVISGSEKAPPALSSHPTSTTTPHTHSNSLNSYASAVPIYSAKLGPTPRQRPLSASNHTKTAGAMTSGGRARPMSASMAAAQTAGTPARPMTAMPPREKPDGAEALNTQFDDEAINSALHRLAMRQQQRQYTANKASNVLSQSNEGAVVPSTRTRKQSWGGSSYTTSGHNGQQHNPHRVQSNVEHYHHLQGSNEDSYKPTRGHSASSRSHSHENLHNEGRRPHTAVHVRTRSSSSSGVSRNHHHHQQYNEPDEPRSANDTFNSFIHDTGESRPESRSSVNKGSQHHQQVTAQMMKQQKMMEASRNLLEQSKAKHQAMVAQAHAAQKSKQDSHSAMAGSRETLNSNLGSQELAPKPPPNPSSKKKPSSSHRLARVLMRRLKARKSKSASAVS